MPRLIVIRGVDEGKPFELAGAVVTVGRHSSNEIALHDTEVSRRHLELRATADGYQLVDLGSGNGTRVNDRPVQVAPLRAGDTIALGQTVLMYTAGGNDPSPANDLSQQVRLFDPGNVPDFPSAIVRTVDADVGSQILTRPAAATDWVRTRLANLAALYQTADAVSHILDIDQLLARLMELVVKSVDADHGCFLLRDAGTGRLVPRAVRYRDGTSHQEEIGVSRTIVDHVLRENQGVLVADAQTDERFRGGESVYRHHIREAICVPMKGRREVVGVLFLDTQVPVKRVLGGGADAGIFTADHLHLASAIAHQAAIAVEESRYHRALIGAERLAAVGQTIAALSHHIKNIMQGVRFGSDMVRIGLAEGDADLLGKGWKLVEKNQARIDHLILDMLSYSKDREPAVEPTDLNALCEDVLEVVRGRAAERGIILNWEPGPGLTAVPADPDGLHRALLNLVGNALDAVDDRPDPAVTVRTLLDPDGGWATVIVRDNGPGIAADQLAAIFEPFVSTKGSRGTGLGLPVSRKILREHGGDLLVQSEVGVGTTFTARIPGERGA